MFRVRISNDEQKETITVEKAPITFGRRPSAADGHPIVLRDEFVSRNQLLLHSRNGQQVRLSNTSGKVTVQLRNPKVRTLPADNGRKVWDLELPLTLRVGKTAIEISTENSTAKAATTDISVEQSLQTISEPVRRSTLTAAQRGEFSIHAVPDPSTLAAWFERLVSVQRAAAGSDAFYQETAQAVVDLVGLDYGMVLLRRDAGWTIVAKYDPNTAPDDCSRTLIERVAVEKKTLMYGGDEGDAIQSLAELTAWVASPIFDAASDEVIGVVYGGRILRAEKRDWGISPLEAHLVQVLAAAVGSGLARQENEADAIRARVQFEQFVAPELVRELDRNPDVLQGQDREVTILFADIRNFSKISQQLGAQLVYDLIVAIMDRLGARVREFYGTMVDYLGDGLFAMWNAPLEQPNHAELACHAALAMIGDLAELNREWADKVGGAIRLGIGLNTGVAMVGNNGSRTRLHYGPMGHHVNLASRVEGATKQLGVPILITGATKTSIGETFPTRRICNARLVGVEEPVTLYELCTNVQTSAWAAHRNAYEHALNLYESGQWGEACAALVSRLGDNSAEIDSPTVSLVARAVEFLKSPPASFDPAWDLTQK